MGLNFPHIKAEGRFIIWIHAVSVGETKAIYSLLRILKKQHDNPYIIISSITETGHIEAKKSITCADLHIYLPFDLSWIIHPIVKSIRPNLVIISETDFWYNFLASCKQFSANIVLVNGKISEKSCRLYQKFLFYSKNIFNLCDVLCVQSEEYLKRFALTGVDIKKLFVTGNLKLDNTISFLKKDELALWKEKLGINESDQVLVIGSTHHKEEEAILNSLDLLIKQKENLKIVLVPRHPERFDEVTTILKKLNLPFTKLSKLNQKKGNEKIIFIDSMGLLNKCYQFADLAIVGGSFYEGIGGHNIIEPCQFLVPTLFGPYMENQKELVVMVKQYRAGLQLNLSLLNSVVERLLNNHDERKVIGENGLMLIKSCGGATHKTSHIISSFLNTLEHKVPLKLENKTI